MSAPLALITTLKVNSSNIGKYLDWLTRLMMLEVESSGIISAEIFPSPSLGKKEWVLVQQFCSLKHIEGWLKSNEYQKLMQELAADLDNHKITLSESINSNYTNKGNISVAAVTQVKEGFQEAYFAYEKKYQAAQAQASGYRGTYVQPPKNGTVGNWLTVMRFDSQQSMDQWFDSDERKNLVIESDQFVSSIDFHNVTTSFPGWFPTEATPGEGPPNWKTALLILLGLYPSVMLVIKYFLPLMQGFPPALSNFIGNILTVAFTTWVTMPLFIKIYKSWLFPHERTPKWVNPLSVSSILFFFAIEIAFFWRSL